MHFAILSRRHRLSSLLIVLGFVLVALLVSQFEHGTFEARASIRIDPNDAAIAPVVDQVAVIPDVERFVLDQEALLRSERLLSSIAARVEEPAEVIRKTFTVARSDFNNVLEVVATHEDPGRAQEIANTVASTYLDDRRLHLERRFEDTLDLLDEQIDRSAGLATDSGELRALGERRAEVAARAVTVTLGTELLSGARLPVERARIGLLRWGAVGAVAGSAVVLALVAVREQLRPQALGLRAIAVAADAWPIGRVRRSSDGAPEAGDVDAVVGALRLGGLGRASHVLAIGAVGRMNASPVVKGLVTALGGLGSRTVLLDAAAGTSGVESANAGNQEHRVLAAGPACSSTADNVFVLPQSEAGTLLETVDVASLIASCRDEYDLVVIDGTRLKGCYNLALMCQHADMAVLFVAAGEIYKEQLEVASSVLTSASVVLAGVVAVDALPGGPPASELLRHEAVGVRETDDATG